MIHIHIWHTLRQERRIGELGIEYTTTTTGCRCGKRRTHTQIGLV